MGKPATRRVGIKHSIPKSDDNELIFPLNKDSKVYESTGDYNVSILSNKFTQDGINSFLAQAS